jgi:hypothetical protein
MPSNILRSLRHVTILSTQLAQSSAEQRQQFCNCVTLMLDDEKSHLPSSSVLKFAAD